MKYLISLILILFLSAEYYPQVLSMRVVDKKNGEAVQYANVGIMGKNIGTVSDGKGMCELKLNDSFNNDSLLISCIGFESKIFRVENLKRSSQESNRIIIELEPKIYQLDEVIVKTTGLELFTLGNFCEADSPYGNSFPSKNLGTEIGIMIDPPSGDNKCRLRNFRFYVGEFTYDFFTVRLNVYNLKDGLPNQNILKEQIFIDITSAGEYIIDLKRKNIVISGEFFVSLEYFKIPDQKEGKLIFCAVHNPDLYGGNGYYRLTSHGEWNREFGDNLGFSVEVDCEQ